IFAEKGGLLYGGGLGLLGIQTLGVVAVSLWGFVATYGLFAFLKAAIGIRVTVEEELEGLDMSEHGITAYSDLECNPLTALSPVPSVRVLPVAEQRLAE
ncbi:MAG: nrgA 3, partial [Sporomusa sp.]|nr:nrgA 3 [Sporomusa sp.]